MKLACVYLARRRQYKSRRCRPAEPGMVAAIPPTIPEEDATEMAQRPQAEQHQAQDADYHRSPRKPVKSPDDKPLTVAVEEPQWCLPELLWSVPVVERVLTDVLLEHERLKAANWLYLAVYVYVGCVAWCAWRLATFPVLNVQLTRLADRALTWLLHRLLVRVPHVFDKIDPQRSLASLVHDGLLAMSSHSLPARVFSGAALLTLRLYLMAARCVLVPAWFYATASMAAHQLLNADLSLKDAPLDRLPLVLATRVLAFFWRRPYNALYDCCLQPLFVQPTGGLQVAADLLKVAVDGEAPPDAAEDGVDPALLNGEVASPTKTPKATGAEKAEVSGDTPGAGKSPVPNGDLETTTPVKTPTSVPSAVFPGEQESPLSEHL